MCELMFKDENDIIEYVQSFLETAVLFNDNSFEKKILKMLKSPERLSQHNSHGDLPPDFISYNYSMMFDVMRVNDSEVKKDKNPVMQREGDMFNDLKESKFLKLVSPDVKIICHSESENIEEHSFDKYKRNVIRVTSKHLSSKAHKSKIKEIWENNNPEIKYKGFFIFDETEACFEGYIKHIIENNFEFVIKNPLILHEPWNDKDFIQWAYDSEIDFIIWFCPYKPYWKFLRENNIKFPHVVIMDVRFSRNKPYITYNGKHMVL